MGPNGMMGGMWVFMLLWFLLGVAVLAALVAGVVWLVRRSQRPPGERGPSPVEELERRYARGEIDREEYLERRVYLGDAQEERRR